MSEFYNAIIDNGSPVWVGTPPLLPSGTRVKVIVDHLPDTPPTQPGSDASQRLRLLREVVQTKPFAEVDDPVQWQRDLRAQDDHRLPTEVVE